MQYTCGLRSQLLMVCSGLVYQHTTEKVFHVRTSGLASACANRIKPSAHQDMSYGLLIKLNQVRKCKEVWNTDGNGHAAGRTDD